VKRPKSLCRPGSPPTPDPTASPCAPSRPQNVEGRRCRAADSRLPVRRPLLLRGSLVHRLMQSLRISPPSGGARRPTTTWRARGADLPVEERARLAEQVMLILEDPRFYECYGPASRAEVPIVGRLDIGGKTVRVSGQIDRLAVTQTSVLIADFKTNRPAAATNR